MLRLPESPREWEGFYRGHLLDGVLPYWMQPGVLDQEYGGLLNCRTDEGVPISDDKYLWSQTRGLWTFSALCRRFENRPEWRRLADSLFDFCRRHGREADGRWRYRVSREGTCIDGPLSIATDCFAVFGLTEYARLTGDGDAAELAGTTARQMNRRIRSGQPFGIAPYVLPPGMKSHGIAMVSSLALLEVGELLGDRELLAASEHFSRQILDEFIRPEHRAIVEYVNADGTFSDTPEGRAMVPGHGIESLWFQLEIFRRTGRRGPNRLILEALEWSLNRGWDVEYGGLQLAVDILGRSTPFWAYPTTKPWWPATEALVATLMAYEIDRSDRWLWWHRRIIDWALQHYPVPGHGEWRQRLDREGRPFAQVIGLPVKDPFHLPRGLLLGVETLERLRTTGDPLFA